MLKKQVQALKENRFDEFLSLITESGNSSWKWLQNCYVPGSEEQGIHFRVSAHRVIYQGKRLRRMPCSRRRICGRYYGDAAEFRDRRVHRLY